MSDAEQQTDEQEVLMSIYDGDPSFKQVSPTVYQYKYGDDGASRSFVLEISWGPTYPSVKPAFNLEAFYNRNLLPSVKETIISYIDTEAEQYLGMPVTYTIFESIKEKLDELLKEQPETLQSVTASMERVQLGASCATESDKPKEKKEHLTKAQKRRQWDKADSKGQKARGWDWVDVVKHLCQTGSKAETG
ncbi:RWD domain-containing protein 4 isoform X2 [Thrips palmi]|nr:RWD domain-containing protein 4 isoform X2 [Thrips palmi]XP_034252614.1 RWD domain-containing protein 4 isoform X2 [Thrips palmi]XP_034252615.1 RWD domain-containing protein 4 isoform X2 [Thrips palmi]